MTLTIQSAQSIFSNTQVPSLIPATIALFDQLNVDDQLAYLWYAYTEMGKTITPAAPGAARLQLAESLLTQIKLMSPEEQTKVMRDLASRADTPISRSYGFFSVNTKLAFWYELGELMKKGLVTPIPVGYQMSPGVKVVLEATQKLDQGQQITVLRNTVVNMGFDTSELAPSSYPKSDSEPAFQRTTPTISSVKIEGITEPAVLGYIEAMNADNFDAAIALFTPDGALQPPFQKPIIGTQAIAKYMREEAQGLNMMPQQGICEVRGDGSKQLKITGVVQTPWFGVTVGMNIAWRFLINPEGKIFFVAIDMLASPQELLQLTRVQ
ncbi:Red carotenoid-binding protein [Anabaena cylindrica FACHB-243]|uniref:Orange carotenoid-binding protein n=1 Tax=Anabaena cylindrica (strain ATCC 27899 / PCC 7122) TaxID=272123 RepID=K9ZNN8_ANACC|nr:MULTISPECIES: orange carotenoid protein N-terminal domain-containing protein [Anabaena]AFZ60848.1 Orange carotenoid-binding protein [Anabaena cylindrica PCC 7122]MBD2420530.1 Red carotenoid-binding protein [Anabaena cylindrica FACHB-243]MBY5281049.1 Red carotenoid-binding protein [Anabaena sp. CCAP 1446/1C]MBY5309075.1 Red carotenoid-binding protein [Anabaena sp. CCAP 1446/1C]MCM2406845.1 orange carotenoid-binding protein [Anabaena sp. CCAP 1446/1C]